MQNYSTLQEVPEQEESGVLIHVAEPSRARWNHIEDLDSFFSRMYRYHQKHGFLCMVLQESLELIQFIFVVTFSTFLFHFVNYPVLFKDKLPPNPNSKVTLYDIILPFDVGLSSFGLFTWLCLTVALFVWLLGFIRGIYHIINFWDIKQFYNSALGIADSELDNLTWHEVQTKVRQVQLEQQMCIHKRELTELDIYHRILRQHNYLVAMTNKHLLPPRLKMPFSNEEIIYWTRGLRYNVQLLLFSGPWAPFEHPWHLREQYRKQNLREELARQLKRQILVLALANLILSPLVLLWQILYAFFNHAEVIKREPGSLGVRNWSMYGKLYLRHFNELDHELQARLSRAHRPATRYLTAFSSPLAAVVAKSLAFMCGAVLAVLVLLTVYDEDVLSVEHVLTCFTILGGCVAVCRGLIPDETLAWCPETLLSNVLIHTHYLPPGWRGRAHTSMVRKEFQQLFQYRVVALLEELLSPILTPYVLAVHLRSKALDIVDFYRNFTVSVVGVGDVCSFAQMDVRRHGNPEWQPSESVHHQTKQTPDQYTQAEEGKTELSLIHFKVTNPKWKPPKEAEQFVESIMKESCSLQSPPFAAPPNYFIPNLSMQGAYSSFSPQSFFPQVNNQAGESSSQVQVQIQSHNQSHSQSQSQNENSMIMNQINPNYLQGNIQNSFDFLWQGDLGDSSLIRGGASRMEGPTTSAPNEMSLSTMYLHDRHFRQHGKRYTKPPEETTPLLFNQ